MSFLPILAAGLAAVLVGRFLYRWIFDNSEDFWDCVGYSFTPDLFSLFRGKLLEDWAKSFKLTVFLMGVGFIAYTTYSSVDGLMKDKEEPAKIEFLESNEKFQEQH